MCRPLHTVRVSAIVTPMTIALAGSALPRNIFTLSCPELWFHRNSIFKSAGYCFHTPRAIRVFGNAWCGGRHV
jgi:YARHG domain